MVVEVKYKLDPLPDDDNSDFEDWMELVKDYPDFVDDILALKKKGSKYDDINQGDIKSFMV